MKTPARPHWERPHQGYAREGYPSRRGYPQTGLSGFRRPHRSRQGGAEKNRKRSQRRALTMHASRRRHPTQDEGQALRGPRIKGWFRKIRHGSSRLTAHGSRRFPRRSSLAYQWSLCREKLSASNRLKSRLPVWVPSCTDMEFTFRYWPVLPPVGGRRECDFRPSWARGACGRALQSSPPPGKCQIMACASGMALRKPALRFAC